MVKCELRPLGRTGRSISAVGLGCVTFGREIDEAATCALLDHAVEKGVTWLDTAEGYGGGNARAHRKKALGVEDVREVSDEVGSSELIIGRWLRSRACRDRISICTKVSTGARPDNIRRAVETSLNRLHVDCIDIYKLHSFDTTVPLDESLAALTDEVRKGRIQVVGCSNFDAQQLRQALDVAEAKGYARMEIVQPPYSLVAREAETNLFSLCREEQIATSTYSPLAAGFLAGKYAPGRDAPPEGSRFHIMPGHIRIYFNDRNFAIVERLREKSRQLGVPMVRLAMAWAMSHPDVTSTLVGARSPAHLDNAIDALATRLDPAVRAEMSAW